MADSQGTPSNWKYITTYCNEIVCTNSMCPARPYLSLKIPDTDATSEGHIMVRRVIFTTLSHDQGFASANEHLNGTYDDSNTWFDVHVIDRLGQNRCPPALFTRNRRGTWDSYEHKIRWDFYGDIDSVQGKNDTFEAPSSTLLSAKWLSLVRSGDTIQMVPRALYAAWINFVIEARIELWVETIPAKTALDRDQMDNMRSLYAPMRTDNKDIRVVRIEPSGSDPHQLVRVILSRTNLNDSDRVHYEALSYCWGDEQSKASILVSGEIGQYSVPFPISLNLERALRRIRRHDVHRIFWIDLLCINQNDLEERNEQVAIMSEIYASAQGVCVWLGELDEIRQTQEDLEKISTIAAAFQHSTEWSKAHMAIQQREQVADHDRIFLRPWFQRVWVLQEVWNAGSALGEDDGEEIARVSVLCGPLSIPWWIVMQANACLSTAFRALRKNTMPFLWTELFDISRPSQGVWKVKPASRADILTVIVRGLDFKATDARDRIFALLGFGRETHKVTELPALIRPDYNKSAAQVFCDFTLWWIKEYQSLRILSAVHTLRERTWLNLSGDYALQDCDEWPESAEQPTWTLWLNGNSVWARGTLALNEPVMYRACGDYRLDMALFEGHLPSVLGNLSVRPIPVFKGVQISKIGSIKAFSHSRLYEPELAGMAKAYIQIFDPTGRQGTWANTGSDLGEPEETMTDEILYDLQSHLLSHPHDEAFARDSLPCLGQCLFQTVHGSIGLCPSGARVGDVVVVLYGGLVPYLLRPRQSFGFYAFIGECYVHGIMHGELFNGDGTPLKEDMFHMI